ncbi:hypothetical protein D3C78_1082540 [compost metagenome]
MIELPAELQNSGHVQTNAFGLQQLHLRIAVGDHHRHITALLDAKGVGDALTEDHLLLTAFEIGPGIALHVFRQRAELVFLLRINAFDTDRTQLRAIFHQAGKVDIGGGSQNAGHLLHPLQNRRPVFERLFHRFDFTVRHHRQNAIFQLALKTVHGTQADDQHRHAQRNTDS